MEKKKKLARAKLLAIVFSRREATHVVVLPLPFFPTFLFLFYGVCGEATVAWVPFVFFAVRILFPRKPATAAKDLRNCLSSLPLIPTPLHPEKERGRGSDNKNTKSELECVSLPFPPPLPFPAPKKVLKLATVKIKRNSSLIFFLVARGGENEH